MSAGPVNLSGSATEGECAATAATIVAAEMTGRTEQLEQYRFADRHIGPDAEQQTTMLEALGYDTLDDLTAAAVASSSIDALARSIPVRSATMVW